MSAFSSDAKHTMLDALGPDTAQLHDGDPGSDGTANQISGQSESASFDAAAGEKRQMSADVPFDGMSGNQPVTWYSVWNGSVFLGKGELSGDTQANGDGQYTLKADQCALMINDPSS